MRPCQQDSALETPHSCLSCNLGLRQRSLHSLAWRKTAESPTPGVGFYISGLNSCQQSSLSVLTRGLPECIRRCGCWPARQLSVGRPATASIPVYWPPRTSSRLVLITAGCCVSLQSHGFTVRKGEINELLQSSISLIHKTFIFLNCMYCIVLCCIVCVCEYTCSHV